MEALQLLAEAKERKEIPEHPFSARTARALTDFWNLIDGLSTSSRVLDLVALFNLVVGASGYQQHIQGSPDGDERWENILELRSVAQEYQDINPPEGLSTFLEKVSLVSDVDSLDETTDRVTLITLHQAKGLEFPIVFIIGMEERLLPHFRSFDDPAQMEEERRLCYVGITRAKRHVYLVYAFRRTLMGSNAVNQPSRFLDDIPQHLISSPSWWRESDRQVTEAVYSWNEISYPGPPDSEPVSTTSEPSIPELKAGDHVRHAYFGRGVVVSCKDVNDDREVVVAFDGQGVKRLLLSLARLEKVG
jgi:DNA helicase-2/ATP-dependent DNA helicase PcrA